MRVLAKIINMKNILIKQDFMQVKTVRITVKYAAKTI